MSRLNSPARFLRLLALGLALALIAAACVGESSSETTTTAATSETTTTAGGGEATTTTAGSEPEPAGESTLTIAWQWDPGTMDPQMHRQRYTQIVSHAMRDKLFYQTPPGLDSEPLLAEELIQIDETTYEAKLREGVLFHNGDELTADDVVFTFQRLWDPATESPRASMGNMSNIESIEAVDRYTVRWVTKVPFGPPADASVGLHLQGQEILHKATYENLSAEEAGGSHDLVGVGAFKFVEWIPDQRLVMEAFDDYWQGAPLVDQLIWRTIPEESTRTAELLAGSVDMIHPVTVDFVDQLRDAGMKLEIVPGTEMRMLQMNVREGSPFADPEVRRAMNMAIDKQAIVDSVFGGLAVVSHQVPGSNQQGYIEGWQPFEYDPDAARELLSQITEPIELYAQPQMELPAEVVAEMLRGYGMDVSAVVLEQAAFVAMEEAGDYDLMLGYAGYGSGKFHGAYTNNHFECVRFETNRIRTGFCDEEVDRLLAEALELQATDPTAADAALEEAVRLLTEVHMPWVPLFVVAETWAMQPYVNGFVGSSAGQMFDLHKVSVDK